LLDLINIMFIVSTLTFYTEIEFYIKKRNCPEDVILHSNLFSSGGIIYMLQFL